LLFFDTFDWRIYRKGWTLVREGSVYRLRDRRTGELLAGQAVESSLAPRFAWEFDPGPLREHLASVIKVRALLHLLTVRGLMHTCEINHPKSSQRWLLEFRTLSLSRRGREMRFMDTVAPRPLDFPPRGKKWLARHLQDAGFRPVPPTLIEPALARGGIQPRGYSGKIKVSLEPDLPSGEAAILIARRLLKTMNTNLEGLRKDIDTEFLHDFRVAARRTRSLLTLMKGVLPSGVRKEAQQRFSLIGQLTGPLRDLDVYLLLYPEYLELAPKEFHPGLREIFARAARRRAVVRREMDSRLEDNELQALLLEWDQFLTEGPEAWDEVPDRARLPIGTLARRLITKRYQRVCKVGTTRGGNLADEDLHRLRIECKKLRYTLEFFSSLFPGMAVASLVSTLKKFQDQLGDFNDLVVQLEDLRSLLAENGANRLSPRAAAAAGALMIILGERKAAIRNRFGKVFTGFAGPETANTVKKLVGSG
jgi:CHAD domain-containing protein